MNNVRVMPRPRRQSIKATAFPTRKSSASLVFEPALRLASSARAELRAVERDTAMRILLALTRYAETGEGDVKALEGKLSGTHRLRVGDWRVRFRRAQGGTIHLLAVENRSQAY
jgi:mRNA-degrading endonuclease RelE of RelBE toxin-antitoxin system